MRHRFLVSLVLALCLGVMAASAFATNFIVNPGFEDGTAPAAPPWSFWGGDGGKVLNPLSDTNNSSTWVWLNEFSYSNVAAQNNMGGVWLIPGATYHVHGQYYVPTSLIPAGKTMRAGVELRFQDGTPNVWVLDPRTAGAAVAADQWVTIDQDWTFTGTNYAHVNYMPWIIRAWDGTTLSSTDTGGYFDNLQFSSDAYTGVVNGVVRDGAGLLSGATVQIGYNGAIMGTITTAADGAFSFADLIPGQSYTLTVGKTTYLSQSATVTASATQNFTLGLDPAYDPNIYFNALSSALPGANGAASGNWPLVNPGGSQLTTVGTPTVMVVNGQKMAMNKKDTDGYHFTNIAWNSGTPDSITGWNGGTIVVTCRPLTGIGPNAYQQLVSVLLDQFAIGVQRDNGQLRVWRGGTEFDSPTYKVPNGQMTTFSFVVQPTGEFKVFANGTEVMNETSTYNFTTLTPTDWYRTDVNVGRAWDGWSSFNGNIGDVYVYKVALDDTTRQNLENALITKFGEAPLYTIAASVSSGNGTITPAGTKIVPLAVDQTYTITPATGWQISDVLVDGASVGAVTTYTFPAVSAAHTIVASFTELPKQTVSGTVTNGTAGIAGASVFFSATANASVAPLYTVTTDASGNYSVQLPGGSWFACAAASGYAPSSDITFTVADSAVTGQNITLVANGRNIPAQDKLLFAALTQDLVANGATTDPWAPYMPKGMTAFATQDNPSVATIDGAQWEVNDGQDAGVGNDGYRVMGPIANPIAVDGATIIVAIQPTRAGTGRNNWQSIVDTFYDRLCLGISNFDGTVCVRRNSNWGTDWALAGTEIPDGQKTILSLVVQNDGSYKLYANSTEILTGAAQGTDTFKSLRPNHDGTQPGPGDWGWDGGFTHYINIGRNDPDGWTAFNGNIGDVLYYKVALSDTDREAAEGDIANVFGVALPNIPFSGKVTLEDGVTPVAGAAVTASGMYNTYKTTTAADGTYSMKVTNDYYQVSVTKDSYQQTSADFYAEVSAATVYDFQMKMINAIGGTVKNAAGQPVANAVVQVGVGGPAAITDANGKYLVTSITSGPGVSFYADALGYADSTETIDTSDAATGAMTKDVTLTAKVETDNSYIQNGGFETGDLTGWTADNASTIEIGVTNAVKASGNYAAYWKAKEGIDYYQGYLRQLIPVVPGSTYNIYWKLRTDATGCEGQSGFDLLGPNYDDWWGYAGGGTSWMYTPAVGQWEQTINYRTWDNSGKLVAARLTPPAGVDTISIIAGLGTHVAGDTLYVDDVVVDRVGPATPGPVSLTASAGAGGTISPAGTVSVAWGSSPTFTITPNAGYAVDTVTVDGNVVAGAPTSYTFNLVVADGHTITATFKQAVTVKPVGVNNKSVLTDGKLIGKTVRVWGAVVSKDASSYVIDDGYGAGVTINGTTTLNVGEMAIVTGVVQANKSVTAQ